mmetsp:Transcript_25515/g.37436  ORF Transcript_25515/g.37436 Transcript_25515/m.37436 type:complete len:473 (-) Transcript_25515:164-1582(-)
MDTKQQVKHIFLTGQPGVGKSTILIHAINHLRKKQKEISIQGFYTKECRGDDGKRIGFDIITFSPTSSEQCVAPLARMGKPKKNDAAVGNYIVDVDAVASVAVPSIDPSQLSSDPGGGGVIVMDEIGKMELKCPTFLPAVTQTLNSTAAANTETTIILGTLPTPRYGRIIPCIEDIRARKDVIVVLVTKANRDSLKNVMQHVVSQALKNNNMEWMKALEPYIYTRPIDAPSMNGSANTTATPTVSLNKTKKSSSSPSIVTTTPCGPLVHSHISPRVLLLGQTSSPMPTNVNMQYSERSLWTILAPMFQSTTLTTTTIEEKEEHYTTLKDLVLTRGFAIWDVLQNVHEKTTRKSRSKIDGKRQKPNSTTTTQITPTPNEIPSFLNHHNSIVAIAFIGKQAFTTFRKHFAQYCQKKDFVMMMTTQKNDSCRRSRCIKMIVLPSSSRANSRVTLEEKVDIWKHELMPLLLPPISE